MYIITATFEAEAALGRAGELLALGDSPERLAERLGATRDLDMIKIGVAPSPFKQVTTDLQRIKKFVEIEEQIAEIKEDKSMLRFLGTGFKEKQIAKLEEARRKLGALIEAPVWFYKQPRVQLLAAIRDYALDGSQQGDAAWVDLPEEQLVFPIAKMFETADLTFAQALIEQLERPLKDVDPKFLLEKFEGNRSISFDFEKSVALYYTPAPSH